VYGGKLFLEKNCFTWHFSNITELVEIKHSGNSSPDDFILKGHAYKTNFINANPEVPLNGKNKFSNYYNFFLGNDSLEWKGNVPAYGNVHYDNLYKGIDLIAYSDSTNFKYDFVIEPNANPAQIQLQYDGLDNIYIENGDLILITSINKIVEQKPVAYQIINNSKTIVACEFMLNGNTVTFNFPTGYNSSYELTIDPATLIFASYSGSTADNWGYSATYDEEGNLYGAGIVFNIGYPTTIGAYQEDYQGGSDIAISKFTADGTDLIYSTYLGGSNEDLPHSLIVDSEGQLIVYGTTGSDDYPTTAGCYDNSFNGGSSITISYILIFDEGSDIIVTKFGADGGSLIGSTYFGGTGNDGLNQGETLFNYNDATRGDIYVNETNECYIASCTYSNDLPVTSGVFQNSLAGGQDAFIIKFNNDLSEIIWGTYLGGTDQDAAYSIKQADDETIYVCGGTTSTDFPSTASSLNENYLGGTADGFIAKLSADADSLLNCTFIGTEEYDQSYSIALDSGDVYVMGQTLGDYPVTPGVYSDAGGSQYISKLNSDLSANLFSTVFGSGSGKVNISPTAFDVDACGNIYCVGWGGGINSSFNSNTDSVAGMPVTPDAYQTTTDGNDFYLIQLAKDAADLKYASFFGGSFNSEHSDGGNSRINNGIIYQAVCAGCGGSDDFPVTPGAWSQTNNSSNCNLGVFKFQLNTSTANASFLFTLSDSGNVSFNNLSSNATGYLWNFGDPLSSADTSNLENTVYTYTSPGTYEVTLIAYGECSNDTITQFVTLGDDVYIIDNLLSNQVLIYPNPTSQIISLQINVALSEIFSIRLFDSTGQLIKDYGAAYLPSGENNISIDLTILPSDIYLLKVQNSTDVRSFKIVLN
jgi:PKD repeat protein